MFAAALVVTRRRLTLVAAKGADHSAPSKALLDEIPKSLLKEDRCIVAFLVPNDVPSSTPLDLDKWARTSPILATEDIQKQGVHIDRLVDRLACDYEKHWQMLLGNRRDQPTKILPDSEKMINYCTFLICLYKYVTLWGDKAAREDPQFGKKEWDAFLKLVGVVDYICQSILSQLKPESEKDAENILRLTIQKYRACLSDKLTGRLVGWKEDLAQARTVASWTAKGSRTAILDLHLTLGRLWKIPRLEKFGTGTAKGTGKENDLDFSTPSWRLP